MEKHDVRVYAFPSYVEGSQSPWQFNYRIEIENHGSLSVQLLRRRWLITDGEGRHIEVEGPGVVGEEPIIAPGQVFSYQSGVPLDTPLGVMEGSYLMQDEEGEEFEAPISPFTLAVPHIIN
ncbi:Co2+/Mg2+ efflux protein ApaG [Aeromonas simiae]|uniref:Co2+/Mg2+ efflux protein ApaG n=1 Tax=Aeromonas simiae TaxID=218936 RepID=UPI00266C7278|nr:Co2+/Mg2+ efflux protein ApaG [Aeromonas simiae]MDO2948415.1 Co2+/Mg2+ efflux protein ApaG [Aeromonas simiae]MDO2951918.1 Co2+/Mg2+ efflux protein ApaG [Aeromonas simiae]MDO2955798.1 Co2+/Mg2+ efflux protein ApaG [Aeromonas simiae]